MFIFVAIENLIKSTPLEFYEEYSIFLELAIRDLTDQAEKSIAENDSVFLANLQSCYMRIPYMTVAYINDNTMLKGIIEKFTTGYTNSKLSMYQLSVFFTTLNLIAQGKNTDSTNTSFFSVELTAKKYDLSIAVVGDLQGNAHNDEGFSCIASFRRTNDTNQISFEIDGTVAKKFKVDDNVNKSYISGIMDQRQGNNREGIHDWKVFENSKVAVGVLYSQIAIYNLIKGAQGDSKFDKNFYTVDTLLNFSITNNGTLARHACDAIVACALRSPGFLCDVLFYRLCRKLTQYEESFQDAEREKESDYVRYPHKTKTLKHLVNRSLHGAKLSPYNSQIKIDQKSAVSTKALVYLFISVNSPAVYNFNERGNVRYRVIRKYLDSIINHCNAHSVDINEAMVPLINKLATKLFMLSEREHMRKICINTCGTVSSIHEDLYRLVTQRFPLDKTVEQVRKCLKCKEAFEAQYSHISFYDMNHIGDTAASLSKVVPNKLKEAEKSKPEAEVEEIKEAAPVIAPPTSKKALNLLLTGGVKKGKKGAAKKTKKAADKPKPAEKPKTVVEEVNNEAVEENKADRTIRDLKSVKSFLERSLTKSCTYLSSICEIYEMASKGKSDTLLDEILYENVHTFIELLRFPACNFIIRSRLPRLLANNSGENKIFKVKDCINECLLLSAKLLNSEELTKHEVDKQFKMFMSIVTQEGISYANLGRGMIRLILTNITFALKHKEISYAFKDSAVEVAHQILKSSKQYEVVDIIRTAQSLLEQDYSAKGSNEFLGDLMLSLTEDERLVILTRMAHYHSLQIPDFLKVLIDMNVPFSQSEDFEVQLWIKQYLEDPIDHLAKAAWSKYYSNVDVVRSAASNRKRLGLFCRFGIDSFGHLDHFTIEAFVDAIYVDPTLLSEYIDNVSSIVQNCADKHAVNNQLRLFAKVVEETSSLVVTSQLDKLFEFIVYEGFLNEGADVPADFEKAGISVCVTQGQDHSSKILKILTTYLEKPREKRPNIDDKHKNLVLHESLVLIASLAKYFNKSDESTLDIYERIVEMLNVPSKQLIKAISKCIAPLSKLMNEKSKKLLKQLLAMLKKSSDSNTLRGAAYAVAGIVKGLGLKTLEEFEIIETIEKDCQDKNAKPARKMAALNCCEAFASVLGKTFELYLERVAPYVLDAFSHSKDTVQKAAKKALNEILLNTSGYCVRNLISSVFLKGIEEANWKTKLGQIEALCSMALFAPNQVAIHLPEVISSIRAILLDTHPKVQEAGQGALNKITSAMRNQGKLNALAILEVHSEQIAKSSASENLKKSLDRLLDTTFSHSLDDPSLALLMPLIKDGLEAVNREAQIKALRIVGYICNLLKNPAILFPYMNEIAPVMVNLLLTVHPRIRSSSCKALAGLVKGLGSEKCHGMLKWVCKQLRKAYSSDNKNIVVKYQEVECVGKSSRDVLYDELEEIHKMCTAEASGQRTAGATLLVDFHRFVACFRGAEGCKVDLNEYANTVVPMFENALLDANEDVRAVAVKGMKLVIETFGEDYPNLVFREILRGAYHGNYWIRYHTIVLISTLLHILGGDIHKLKKDEAKGQKGKIDCYEEVITAAFILSYDFIERVSFTASSTWQIFVEKRGGRFMVTPFNESPAALNRLIKDLVKIISSDYREVGEEGVRCLNSMVSKSFDRLMEQSLDMIEHAFEESKEASLPQFKYFHHLINCCDEAVSKYRKRVEAIMSKMIVHNIDEVRELSSTVFKNFNKVVQDENFVRDFIKDNFCGAGVDEDPALLELKMTFLRALLDDPHLMVSPILTVITLTPKENDETQFLNRARLLRLWYCQKAAYSGIRHVADPCKMLTLILRLILEGKALFEIEETSQYIANDTYVTMGTSKEVTDELTKALPSLISLIPVERIYEWQERVEDLYRDCVKKNKVKTYVTFISEFIHHPRFQSDSYVDIYIKNLCKYLDTDDEELLEAVISCIESGAVLENNADIIAENLSIDWQDSFVSIFRNEV